jgi:hypothetical protein
MVRFQDWASTYPTYATKAAASPAWRPGSWDSQQYSEGVPYMLYDIHDQAIACASAFRPVDAIRWRRLQLRERVAAASWLDKLPSRRVWRGRRSRGRQFVSSNGKTQQADLHILWQICTRPLIVKLPMSRLICSRRRLLALLVGAFAAPSAVALPAPVSAPRIVVVRGWVLRADDLRTVAWHAD